MDGPAAGRGMMAPVIDEDPELLLRRFGQLSAARPLLERLRDAREDVYLVGGAVRDLMRGARPRELDLLTESTLDPLIERLGATATRHDRFGTATVELDGFAYDLARARRETYAHPGALPAVAPANVEDDLRRRDFTVNAIALAAFGPGRGTLVAAPGAVADLRQGVMRVLHDSSFRDDPTRLLRLALYASRLRFEIEPATLEFARSALAGDALNTVSGERLGAELRRLADEPDPVATFAELHELGIDSALAPGFGLRDREATRRALELLPDDGSRATLVLAAAGLELSASELGGLLARLAFEAAQRDAIVAAAARARPLAAALGSAGAPSEVAAAVDGSGVEAVALAGGLGPAEAAEAAEEWLSRLRLVRLEIGGRDLLKAGVASGPAVGEALRAALAAKLDGRAADRQAELDEALRAVRARTTSLDDDGADDVDDADRAR